MAGRLRTAASPSSTVIEEASYPEAFMFSVEISDMTHLNQVCPQGLFAFSLDRGFLSGIFVFQASSW
jgi:hypothetical protein